MCNVPIVVRIARNRVVVIDAGKAINEVRGVRKVQKLIQNNGSLLIDWQRGKGLGTLLAEIFPKASEEAILESINDKDRLKYVFYKMVLKKLRMAIEETVGESKGKKTQL